MQFPCWDFELKKQSLSRVSHWFWVVLNRIFFSFFSSTENIFILHFFFSPFSLGPVSHSIFVLFSSPLSFEIEFWGSDQKSSKQEENRRVENSREDAVLFNSKTEGTIVRKEKDNQKTNAKQWRKRKERQTRREREREREQKSESKR